MRRSFAAGVLAVVLSTSSSWAQEARAVSPAPGSTARFGTPGTVAIGVDRLFGLTHAFVSRGSGLTTFSVLGPGGLEASVAPYSIPRLAIDTVLAEGLTVGVGAEFAWMNLSTGSNDVTVLGISPRVGVFMPLDERFAFWPRAGISYVRVSSGRDSSLLAVSLEPQLIVSALSHVALTVSPTLDVGVVATDSRVTQLGLQCGVLGWF
jgi:hypothetical protein